MDSELLGRLQPFREEALKRGLPPQDVERWISTARPSGTLVTSGDGPVAGRFGGPLLLPPKAPDPYFPLLATLDCSALPMEVTGLPLPSDGSILLFGFPEMTNNGASTGEVVYLPAGTPVEERTTRYMCVYGGDGWEFDYSMNARIHEQFPQDELRLAPDISLPHHFMIRSPQPPHGDAPFPGHPHAWELAEAWEDTCGGINVDGPLHIGGYASQECTVVDPVQAAALDAAQAQRHRATRPGEPCAEALPPSEEWVLLAQWDVGITKREGSTLHFVIPRQDLAGKRFDRAHVSFSWNP